MKTQFLTVFLAALLSTSSLSAQDGLTINLTGDTGTEQAAKLELIRILNERLNKLTVSQLNARIVVSRGVSDYYKVKEILKMHKAMWGLRSNYVAIAGRLETANPGFSTHQGNGFSTRYIIQLNSALETADVVKDQLLIVIKSGQPIALPPLPTFNITPPSGGDPGAALGEAMGALMNQYGVKTQADYDALTQQQKDEIRAKGEEITNQFKDAIQQQIDAGNKQSLKIIGNVVGMAFGVPGAGNLIAGLMSGDVSALAGLVGTIADNFQIPTDYYDSPTLKLTDAERIKIIDELHLRISEAYQQTIALGASMSSETKTRYKELAQPRNEVILYGPKK